MIHAEVPPFPAPVLDQLLALADQVRAAPPDDRAARARSLWEAQLRAARPAGAALRATLDQAQPGEERLCRWCEASASASVDHVVPLARAPALAFAPENLVGACADCQGAKGAAWHLLVDGAVVDARAAGAEGRGRLALISPRDPADDPLALLDLDLQLGVFVPGPAEPDGLRARYTLDRLQLNRRASLKNKRARAAQAYLGWLADAVRAEGDPDARARARGLIQAARFPSVWSHIKRRADEAPQAALFAALPEALTW